MKRFLFTTQPTSDLGLLTRSLPVAHKLRQRGHQVWFCNSAAAPDRLINKAGFENLTLKTPLDFLNRLQSSGQMNFLTALCSDQVQQEYGGRLQYLTRLIQELPRPGWPLTVDYWSVDHMMACIGFSSSGYARGQLDAYRELMRSIRPDAVVDAWSPMAVLAARSLGIPVITLIQADTHPNGSGFHWWEDPPAGLPSSA